MALVGNKARFEALILEIHGGEGGTDSKLFAADLLSTYQKYASLCGFGYEVLTEEHGHFIVKINGQNVWKAFKHEPGKHVVQRVPPTERNGRRQTSIITVVVMPLPPEYTQEPLKESDLDIKFQCASGPGGQHQNKTASACRAVHRPTGLQIFITGRDQHANKREALHILTTKVQQLQNRQKQEAYDSQRKNQMGNSIGKRGDKVRTYNFIRGEIVDHRLGKTTSNIKEFMKGNFSVLFKED